ncbi:MAG: tetratricopeptide repeat protein, partial [Bacteroidales bacterium]|nr:tetratricopeptide repeat protein [Bacteroidales bacterium]
VAGSYSSIGNAYFTVTNYNKALEYNTKALVIMEDIGDKHGIVSIYIDFSEIYIKQGKYQQALHYLDKSLDFSEKERLLDRIRQIYFLYSEIYSLTGRYQKALEYYKKYSDVKDSVFNAEIGQKIIQLELSHLADQHEKERQIVKEKNETEIKRKNQFIYFLTAITFLIMVLVFLVFNRNRINRKAKKSLEIVNQNISEQNHFLQALMDTIPNPMYYKDKRLRYIGCNSAFEKLHSISKNDIAGKADKYLYPEKLAESFYLKDNELLKNPGMQQFESTIHLSNKEQWNVIFYKNTFYNADGSVAGILGIILNITERKKYELKLKQSEKELRSANATKDKFFSIIAHDLTNPFNAILGFSRLLLDQFEVYNEEERKGMLENIYKATDISYRLLQNLLEWSRAQTGKLEIHPERIDLSILANENISLFKSMAQSKKIRMISEVDYNTIVFADRNMINTVLRNLIYNALKFTPENGKVKVTAEKQNGNYIISVLDNGIGIDEGDIPKLFRIDQQVKRKGTANEEGTGLGLILCREFVEKNGGTIFVESETKKGSKFSFSLPVDI